MGGGSNVLKTFTKEERVIVEESLGYLTIKEIAQAIDWNPSTTSSTLRREYGMMPKREVICEVCGKKFKTKYKQMTCSSKCSHKKDAEIARSKRKDPEKKYRIYQYSAKGRGLNFDLTFEEFMMYWQEPCTYCGDEVETIGLDRVDSTKGYSVDNVVPCCTLCNWMKRDLPLGTFLSHIEKINGRRI